MASICPWLEGAHPRSDLCFRRGELRLGVALQDTCRRLGSETRPSSVSEEDEAWTFNDRNAQARLLVAICFGRILKCPLWPAKIAG